MGFTECPPPSQVSAAGYVATDSLHPAVVVKMTSPRPGWISYDSPDPIYYNNVRATIENLEVPATWLAADVAELQLIICVALAEVRAPTSKTCRYSNGAHATFTILSGDVAVSAYDARTGTKIDEQVIEEQTPGRCPILWNGLSTTVRGEMPPVTEVEEAIQYFVMPAR